MVYFNQFSHRSSNHRTVFIYNLPSHYANVRDVSGWFHSRSVSFISLGDEPGTCFVKFRDARSTQNAFTSLDGIKNEDGSFVKVFHSIKQIPFDREAAICIQHLPVHSSINEVYDMFSEFGSIMSIKMEYNEHSVNSIVEYKHLSANEIAVHEMRNSKKTLVSFMKGSKKAQFQRDDEGFVLVWANGSCFRNKHREAPRAAIGVYFGSTHAHLQRGERVRGPQTIKVAIFESITTALIIAKRHGIRKLKVHTSSKYVIKSITRWGNDWQQKGWQSFHGPVACRAQIEELLRAMELMTIKWVYEPNYSNGIGNKMAHQLAYQAVRYS